MDFFLLINLWKGDDLGWFEIKDTDGLSGCHFFLKEMSLFGGSQKHYEAYMFFSPQVCDSANTLGNERWGCAGRC